MKKLLYYEGGHSLEQVAHQSSGVSILGDIQISTAHDSLLLILL